MCREIASIFTDLQGRRRAIAPGSACVCCAGAWPLSARDSFVYGSALQFFRIRRHRRRCKSGRAYDSARRLPACTGVIFSRVLCLARRPQKRRPTAARQRAARGKIKSPRFCKQPRYRQKSAGKAGHRPLRPDRRMYALKAYKRKYNFPAACDFACLCRLPYSGDWR